MRTLPALLPLLCGTLAACQLHPGKLSQGLVNQCVISRMKALCFAPEQSPGQRRARRPRCCRFTSTRSLRISCTHARNRMALLTVERNVRLTQHVLSQHLLKGGAACNLPALLPPLCCTLAACQLRACTLLRSPGTSFA